MLKTIHTINLTHELSINFPQMIAKCRAVVARFANISFQSAILQIVLEHLMGYLVAINTLQSLVVGNVQLYFSGHYQHYGVNLQAIYVTIYVALHTMPLHLQAL